jgi:hypothetical protein
VKLSTLAVIPVVLSMALGACATKPAESKPDTTPAPSSSPNPGASPTASPSATAKPTPTPKASPTPKPTPTPKPSPTPKAPPTPKPTPDPNEPPKPRKSLVRQIFSGFGLLDWIFPPKKEVPKAQPAQLIGTVKLVNKEEKFVLIDTLTASSVATGDHLLCIMDERQTGSLKMTSLRNPPFLIADITDGTPAVGDRVYAP